MRGGRAGHQQRCSERPRLTPLLQTPPSIVFSYSAPFPAHLLFALPRLSPLSSLLSLLSPRATHLTDGINCLLSPSSVMAVGAIGALTAGCLYHRAVDRDDEEGKKETPAKDEVTLGSD